MVEDDVPPIVAIREEDHEANLRVIVREILE